MTDDALVPAHLLPTPVAPTLPTFEDVHGDTLQHLNEAITRHNELHEMHLAHHIHVTEACSDGGCSQAADGEHTHERTDPRSSDDPEIECCANCRPLGDVLAPMTRALVSATQSLKAAKAAWPVTGDAA